MIPFLDLKAQYAEHQARKSTPPCSTCSASTQYVLGEEVAAFEREFAAYCGAKHAHRRQHRHERAASGAARGRRRARRRGHHHSVHLRRDRVGDLLHRRAAGLRRYRPAHASRWTRPSSKRRSRRAPRRSCRSISTARWPTWTPSWRSPNRHGIAGHRGCLPGARRRVSRPARRQHRRIRLLQLLSRQESRRLRRRRHRRHQRRRARRRRCACCATGARSSATTTC